MRCLIDWKDNHLLKLIIILNFIFYAAVSNAAELLPFSCEINSDSIAKIKLDTRLNQIKKIYPTAKLTRTSDGDGAALVLLTVNNQELAIIYANEDNPDAPIDLSNKIEAIVTFNFACKSKFGIGPGTTVKKAASLLGGIEDIMLSEIESREFIEFKKQPKNLIYQIDYCGNFKNDIRHTKKYQQGCKILSIGVSK